MSSLFSISRTVSVDSAAMPSLLGHPALEFKSLDGREALGELFEYTVRLQTPDNPALTEYVTANVPVKHLIGKEFGLRLELDGKGFGVAARTGAGTREINGLVTSASFVQHENRRGLYQITLAPWLTLATRTSDYRIFQDKTPLQIIEEVLADYSFPTEKRLTHRYPQRVFQVQYGETDFEFITRLMQEFGIYYFFEHKNGAHKLVLVDDVGAHMKFESQAYHAIAYHPPGHKIDEEYCDNFCSIENLESGQWVSDDFDFTKPRSRLQQVSRMPRNTGNNAQEMYRWPGDYSEPDEGLDLVRTRMEASGAPGSRGQGSGNLRAVVTGCTFSLAHYPQDIANIEYLVIASTLRLHESGQASGQEDYVCRCDFAVQPAHKIFRSPQTQAKPRTTGPQTAIVTGPGGQEIWTDEYGRIKASFHWNRYCTKDENASCWIRVSQSWAGTNFGGMHIPRIGQEVIVDFENGDPDRPIVTGRVYNRLNMPPRQLPEQKNLSGFRSQELSADGKGPGGRSNHLALDDKAGRIQAQLKSDHQCSSLSLGYIGRIEDTAGRKDDRGQGVEVRTDGHGAVRAAKGLLVTTEARPNAQGHITDMGETVARLTAARDLHEGMSDTAQAAKAHEAGDQDAVTQVLKEHNDAIKGKGGKASEGQFPELEEPHLVLASPVGIHSAAGTTTHIASIEHTALSSGGHTSISAGKSLLASVKEAVRLFAYKAIRLTAASAGIDIVALQDSIKLMAKLDIKLEANRITITAKEEILVNGGSSYTRWNASGIVHGTNGVWREHAATHGFAGPMSVDALYPVLPTAGLTEKRHLLEEHFVLLEHAGGLRLPQQKYRIAFQGGRTIEGMTNDLGETEVVQSMVPQIATVEVLRHAEDGALASYTPFVQTPAAQTHEDNGVVAEQRVHKVGAKAHRANDDQATSQDKAPIHTSCDPNNWGLRKSQPKVGDATKWEYPVARAYVEAIKPALRGIDWKNATWPLSDADFKNLNETLKTNIQSALVKTAFGLPVEAMPIMLVPRDIEAIELGMNPDDKSLKGSMRSKDWLLVACKGGVVSMIEAAQDDDGGLQNRMHEFASTLYHEARHAQQFFWVLAMMQQFPDDYRELPHILRFWEKVQPAKIFKLAATTPVPDEPSARAGLKRMVVGMYYWQLTRTAALNKQRPPDKPGFFSDLLPTELPLARKAAYDLLQNVGLGGLSIDVDAMAQGKDGSTGYRTQPWEEDSFACDEVVRRLWGGDPGDLLPAPGFCTKALEFAIRPRYNAAPGEAGHAN